MFISIMFSLVVTAEKKNILPNYQFGERNTVIWDYVTDDFLPKKKTKQKRPQKS